MEIKIQLIPIGHPNRCGIKTTPKAGVVHYTANFNKTAGDEMHSKYVARVYKTLNGKFYEADGINSFRFASVSWFIDKDSATLTIPQNETQYACGDRQLPYENGYKGQTRIAKDIFNHKQNYMTINYELCVNDDWEQTCKNAVEIIARDFVTYNIPINMLFRHYDITGKICPKPFVDNPKAWEDFKKKIENRIKELKKEIVINEVVKLFKDQNMISAWSKDSVKKISDLGLIKGNDQNEFKPQNPVTREEFAVVLDRLITYIKTL